MSDINRAISIYINEADLSASLARASANAVKLETQIANISDKTSPKFTELQTKLDGTRAKMAELEGQISGKVNPSLKQMEDAAKRLYNEWRNMAAGTDAANQKLHEFEKASEAIAITKAQVQGVSGAMKELKENASFLTQMKAMFTAMAAFEFLKEGFTKVVEFVKDSIKEFAAAQLVVKQLNTALENTGRGGGIAFRALKEQAEELSDKLKYVTEVDIQKMHEKLVTYGKISINQIKALTPVILDFAAKQGIPIAEATDAIIKGMEGSGKALKLFGVQLDKGGTAASNYKIIMEQLGSRVKGAADDMAGSVTGSMATQEASIKRLSETVGQWGSSFYTSFALSVATAADRIRGFLEVKVDETAELETNRTAMMANLSALQDANLTGEARRKLIEDTNIKYKEYLPYLLSEKDSIDKIQIAQVAANKQMMLKIFAMSYEKELTTILKDEADARTAIIDLQIKQSKLNTEASAKGLSPGQTGQVREQLKMFEGMNKGMVDNTGKVKTELEDKYKALIGNLGATWDSFQKVLDGNVKESNDVLNKHMTDTAKNAEEELKKLNEFLQSYQTIMEEIAHLQGSSKAAQISPDEKEQQDLINKYDEIFAKVKKLDEKAVTDKLISHEKAEQMDADAKIKIHEAYLAALEVLDDKQFVTRTDKEYAAQQKASKEYYDGQKAALDDQHAHNLITNEQYNIAVENNNAAAAKRALLDFNDTYEQRKTDAKNNAADLEKIETERLNLNKAVYETDIKNWINAQLRKKAAQITQDSSNVSTAKLGGNPIDIANAETKLLQDQLNQQLQAETINANLTINLTANMEAQKLAIIKANNEAIMADATLTEEQKQAAVESGEAKINKAFSDTATQQQNIEKQKYSTIAGYIQQFGQKAEQMLSMIFEFEKEQDTAVLQSEQKSNDNKKASYDKLLSEKRISQAQYNAGMSAMDAKYKADAAAIKKKEFEQDKAMKIIQATINTAVAVTSALSGGPIIGMVLAALTAAMGAVEIGLIAAAPTPQFAKGGVARGATHAQGGISLVDSISGNKVGEMEHNEPYMILSSNTYNNNRPVVDALLHSSLNKNGAPINMDWLGKTPKFNLGGIYDAMKAVTFASGGVFTASAGNNVNMALLSAVLELNSTLSNGITSNVVYGNIVDKGNSLSKAQSRASYSQSS